MQVKTTIDTRSTTTGLIVPKGTIGNVLGFQPTGEMTNDLVIDFGLYAVVILPTTSRLIKILDDEQVAFDCYAEAFKRPKRQVSQ